MLKDQNYFLWLSDKIYSKMAQNNTIYCFSIIFDNSELIQFVVYSLKIQSGKKKRITSTVIIPNKIKITVEETYCNI